MESRFINEIFLSKLKSFLLYLNDNDKNTLASFKNYLLNMQKYQNLYLNIQLIKMLSKHKSWDLVFFEILKNDIEINKGKNLQKLLNENKEYFSIDKFLEEIQNSLHFNIKSGTIDGVHSYFNFFKDEHDYIDEFYQNLTNDEIDSFLKNALNQIAENNKIEEALKVLGRLEKYHPNIFKNISINSEIELALVKKIVCSIVDYAMENIYKDKNAHQAYTQYSLKMLNWFVTFIPNLNFSFKNLNIKECLVKYISAHIELINSKLNSRDDSAKAYLLKATDVIKEIRDIPLPDKEFKDTLFEKFENNSTILQFSISIFLDDNETAEFANEDTHRHEHKDGDSLKKSFK